MLPDLCVLTLAFVLLVLPRRRKWPRSRFLLSCGLYIYFCGILRVTLLPVVSRLPYVAEHVFAVNLRPFRDLLHGWGNSVGQILLNMLLFFALRRACAPAHGAGAFSDALAGGGLQRGH